MLTLHTLASRPKPVPRTVFIRAWIFLPWVLCLSLGGGVASATAVHDFTLDNGLRVLVQEDHRAPVVVVQVWYKVGGSYEQDGATGVSHALEHMMFKRTKNLKTGEFSRRIAAAGGRENAFTTADFTTYFQQRSAAQVEESFALEAERMQHLVLDPAEFANELKVIHEERRLRTDEDPQALAMETVLAHTWQTSPYRQPVIGWAADIDHMQRDELLAWYARYYVPNNAFLVVVGDVDPGVIKKLADKHFGTIPARPVPPLKPRPEVAQSGVKRLVIKNPKLRIPMLVMHYKVPGYTQVGGGSPVTEAWEIYALEVLAAALDGSASARFARELVRGGIALSAGASYSGASRLTDLFSLDGVPREGVDLAQLEAALKAQLDAIKAKPPTEDELARIKTAVVAAAVYQRDSLFSQAMLIGSLVAVGIDWHEKDAYVERIQAVTPVQVQAVARKYFSEDGLTVAYLQPEPQHE